MKKTIKDYNLENKKVIIRVDYNVPIKDNKIVDDSRIVASLETINYALNHKAKIILLSHLGRIKTIEDMKKNSLKIVSERLNELLNRKVIFINSTRGDTVTNMCNNMQIGDIILLENTRYEDLDNKKESNNDLELSKYWASLGDIFINDAFATIHRSHASNVGIAKFLPNGIGFLVEKELINLSKLNNPTRPYTVILGGSKVSDKIGVVETLVEKADYLIIGGAMAFTFLKSKNINVGKSLVEDDYLDFCSNILKQYPNKIILPVDVVVSKEIDVNSSSILKDINNMLDTDIGLDLGTKTIENIINTLKISKTVVWNGPLGYYEIPTYQKSTSLILKYLTDNNIYTILGGGDIVAASSTLGFKSKVSHASTGGGATLEYLEGKSLPGLEVIEEYNHEEYKEK